MKTEKITVFENEEFGRIRTLCINGEPWFAGKDAAVILGYSETAKAVRKHVDEEDKGVSVLDTPGGKQKLTIINESGLYGLIMSSKLPAAKKFKRWVISEVLPAIRKTGGYVSDTEMFINNYLPFADETVKELFRLQMTVIDQLNNRIRRDQPLVEFANQVSDTSNIIDMNAMAKLAREENIRIGRNRLFQWLREKGILMSDNLPYQKYIESGYFKVKESVFEVDGIKKTFQQTFVTGKGQQYIIGRLKREYTEVHNA